MRSACSAQVSDWETAVGFTLQWERLDDRRSCRVAAYADLNLDDSDSRSNAQAWAARTLNAMYRNLNEVLRERSKQLRTEAVQRDESSDQAAELDSSDQPLRLIYPPPRITQA